MSARRALFGQACLGQVGGKRVREFRCRECGHVIHERPHAEAWLQFQEPPGHRPCLIEASGRR
jgi:hypothetical protein